DVAGDDLGVIGSGPCTPDTTTARDVTAILQRADLLSRIPQTHRDYLTGVGRGTIPDTPSKSHPAFAHVTSRVIGNTRLALDGIAAAARSRSLEPDVVATRLAGEAAQVGETI